LVSGGSNEPMLVSGVNKAQLLDSGGSEDPFSRDSSDRISFSNSGKKQLKFGDDRSDLLQFNEHQHQRISSSKEQLTKESVRPSFSSGFDGRRVISGPDASAGSRRLNSLTDITDHQVSGIRTATSLLGSQAASFDIRETPSSSRSDFRRHRHQPDSQSPEAEMSSTGGLLSKLAKGAQKFLFLLIFVSPIRSCCF
jgi:hypothetical protein